MASAGLARFEASVRAPQGDPRYREDYDLSALRGLSERDVAAAVAVLVERMHFGPDSRVPRALLHLKQAPPELEEAVRTWTGRPRLEAARTLWALQRDPSALAAVEQALGGELGDRLAAADMLLSWRGAEVLPLLETALCDPERRVRTAAARALVSRAGLVAKGSSGVGLVQLRLASRWPSERKAARAELAKLRGRKPGPRVKPSAEKRAAQKALRAGRVDLEVLKAVPRSEHPWRQHALLEALADGVGEAATALGELGCGTARSALREAEGVTEGAVREAVRGALARLG